MTHQTPKVAVIPAAGKGTRFLPSTKSTPKEMHPLLNLPLIHHCLNELKAAEVEEVIVINHPDKTSLEKYFSDHGELKTLLASDGKTDLVQELQSVEDLPKVTFAYQKEQLGLAHAILCAENEIAKRDFYLLLPDEIFIPKSPDENPSLELKKSFEKSGLSTISLLEVNPHLVNQYGVAAVEKTGADIWVKDIVEKPSVEQAPSNLILPGRYLLNSSILEQIKNTPERGGEVQFTDSLMLLAQNKGLQAVITKCPRFDGGSVVGFLKANIYAALKDPKISDEIRDFIDHV